MQKCLSGFKQLLGSNNPMPTDDEIPIYINNGDIVHDIEKKKSKFFYAQLVHKYYEPPRCEQLWIDKFSDIEIDFKAVYTKKIAEIKDLKLAETNFKVLNDILPCGVNLVKWKKKASSECSICNVPESVTHLIYECRYSQEIWALVQNVFGSNISLENVILGQDIDEDMNVIMSLIVYLIYKEWLILSFDGKQRSVHVRWQYFKNELFWYSKIYDNISLLKDHVRNICQIVQAL